MTTQAGSEPTPIPLEPLRGTGGGRPRWVAGALVLVVFIGLAVGALIIYRNIVGSALASAEAIPADADIVVTVDLLQLRDTDRLDRLIRAFGEPAGEIGPDDDPIQELMDEIDVALLREADLTLTDDIIPWIGRSASLAVWVPEDFEDEPEVLLSVSVRNRSEAGAFVDKLEAALRDDGIGGASRANLDGGVLVTFASIDSLGDVVLWLGDDLLLAAPSRTTIRAALAARDGRSIADDSGFMDLVAELPDDRLLTIFTSGSLLEDYGNLIPLSSIQQQQRELGALGRFAASVGLTDAGVRFDFAAEADPLGTELLDAVAAIERLPADTYGYLALPVRQSDIVDWLQGLHDLDPFAYDELVAMAVDATGIDIVNEVLPAFGGDFVFAAVPASDGALAIESGVPIALVAWLGVVDFAPVAEALAVGEQLALDEDVQLRGDDPTVVSLDGSEVLAYSLLLDALVVGSSESATRAMIAGAGGLTSSPIYRELDEALPGDGLLAFADLEGILDSMDLPPEDRDPLRPLRGIGVSIARGDRLQTGSMLVLIDY